MAAGEETSHILSGLTNQLPDRDPEETAEWLESLDDLIRDQGTERARYIMRSLLQRAGAQSVGVPMVTTTDYVNTIPVDQEAPFPGDEEIERKYRAWLRWNAAVMVHRAQRADIGVGGHISTYAGAATLYEVGFNHFFRGKDHPGGGDQVFFQGHASPGMYARAFMEGGATAGRTTLTGEGLQHADGHSPILAATNPAVLTYDPAYGYEMGHIIRDGLERMYGPESAGEEADRNLMYYLTVYNEPIIQPAEPENLDVNGVLKGIYRVSASEIDGPRSQILASGVSVPWALEAQKVLAGDWGVSADVWSVTSWTELRRDGMAAEEEAFLNPGTPARVPFVTRQLAGATGPIVAVTDYMKAVPDQIRQFLPNEFASLGADGFGFSDTRAAARRYFKNDIHSVVVRTLQMLAARGEIDAGVPAYAMDRYKLLDVNAGTTGGAGGEA